MVPISAIAAMPDARSRLRMVCPLSGRFGAPREFAPLHE
jgi:hypothetical protein